MNQDELEYELQQARSTIQELRMIIILLVGADVVAGVMYYFMRQPTVPASGDAGHFGGYRERT
jgi:hypothetical protein